MAKSKRKELTGKEILKKISASQEKLSKLSYLERYGIFMGKAQMIEFGLKKVLADEKGFELDKLEKDTLGQTIRKLKKKGLRNDFALLLDDFLEQRNYLAHDFLFESALMNSLLPKGTPKFTKPFRQLSKALFSVEQVSIVFAFLNEQGWLWKQ